MLGDAHCRVLIGCSSASNPLSVFSYGLRRGRVGCVGLPCRVCGEVVPDRAGLEPPGGARGDPQSAWEGSTTQCHLEARKARVEPGASAGQAASGIGSQLEPTRWECPLGHGSGLDTCYDHTQQCRPLVTATTAHARAHRPRCSRGRTRRANAGLRHARRHVEPGTCERGQHSP